MFATQPVGFATSRGLRAACLGAVLAGTVHAAPVPTVSIGGAGDVLIGTNPVTLSVTFDNSASPGAGDIGSGPFVDLYFPVNGADGNAGTSLPMDGVAYIPGSARYLGVTVAEVVRTFPAGPLGGSGCTASQSALLHPLVRDGANSPVRVCGTPGDQLVTLQLPMPSFTPQQPQATILFEAALSNFADYLVALAIRAEGGFWLGTDPSGGAPIYNPAGFGASAQLTPTLFELAVDLSGSKGTTGPGFSTTDAVTFSVAPGQTLDNLDLIVFVDDHAILTGISAPGADSLTVGGVAPVFPLGPLSGDGTANRLVASYTNLLGAGALGTTLFRSIQDAGGGHVINPSNGVGIVSQRTAVADIDWQPLDPRDPPLPVILGDFPFRSLLVLPVQASVANLTDGSPSPGDVLETTVTIQLSDFFAIDDVSMFAVLSDGQRLTGNPQISFTQHGASFSGAVAASNYQLREYFSGGTPGVGGLPDPNAPGAIPGDTVLAIDLSQEVLADLGLNELLGGCVPVGGTGGPLPDCSIFNAGATTATLTYQTTIQDTFTDTFPSGDASVDLGDQLHSQVFVEAATVLNTATLTPTGAPSAVMDTSTAEVAIATGTVATTLYAITDAGTGVTTLNPGGVPVGPDDVVTFRLRVHMPSADFEDLELWDFLPAPALEANQIVSFADTIADGTTTLGSGIPAAGVAMWGPSGVTDGAVNFRNRLAALGTTLQNGTTTPTLTGPGGTVPAACGGVAIAGSESAVNFCFGDFDDPANGPSVIDILFSVTRINTAGIAANGPRLVSLARLETAATNAPGTAAEALAEFSLALVADLSISVTDGVATAVPGNQVTYTIVASNAGPEPVGGVSVADVFPGNLTCSTTSVATGGASGNTAGPFVGDIADSVALPASGSVTYTSVCTIDPAATGTLANTATITPPIGAADPVPGNNTATDTDTLTPQSDVSITKTDGATESIPGQPIVYTVVASNAGPSVATGAAVTDTFPAALTGCSWTSLAAGGATGNTSGPVNGPIAETGLTLPVAATVTYTATCTIDPAARGSLANTAATASAATDPTPGNNSATDTNTLTPQVDLVVTKMESADPATAGGAGLTYTVTVLNDGPSSATSVTLSEVLTLPAGVTIGAIAPSQGSFAAPTWTVGTLAPAASATLTVVLDLASSAAAGADVICDTAAVTGAAEPLVNTGDDSATECTSITRLVDIVVSKVESADPITAGSGAGNLTYTVTVANSGPSDAGGITLTEALTLPAGVSVQSITPSAGSYSDPTWAVGGLTAGAQATLTVVLTADASTAVGIDVICDTATLASVTESQSSTANDSATECTSVSRSADLSINKVDLEDPPSGSTIFYTVTVNNAGPSDATGVVVTDTFPFAFLSAPLTIGCAEGDKGIPTCTLPDIPAGGSAQFTIEAMIIPPPPGIITNVVSVTANEPDPNLTNNQDSEDTTFDTTAPTVEQVTSIAPTRDGELDDCDTVLGTLSSLRATFSEAMATEGPGNIALTNQWRLVQPGPGAPFVTSDCSGSTGTDTVVALDSVSWNPTTLAATVTVASPPLADGQYRLLICEAATDPSGNPLAGDGSTPGTPLLRTFRVDRFNALENAHFDTTSGCSTAPWTSASPAQLEVDTVDRNSVPTSGSAHNALSTAGFDLGQCVPILGGRVHDFEASIRTAVSGGLLGFERACDYYATPNCSGASLGEDAFPLALGSSGAGFIDLAQSVTPPAGAGSALCTFVVSAPAGAVPYGAWLDRLFFGDRGAIFADGFESGDTSAWSAEFPPPVEP